jgi:hypothetical protein
MKLPGAYSNAVSLVGTFLAGVSLLLIIFFFVLTSFYDVGGAYMGILVFIILPVFLVFGLILIPIGMIITIRKMRKDYQHLSKKKMVINFNDPRHRNAFAIFVSISVLFLFLTAIGSYEAFHYTESVEFCGLCHEVMEPEHTAYQNSPHANVTCVECHVGPGADWYVKSKLSGMYQVYSVLLKKYPSPIPTPIHNLRPAGETCLECHWPDKFYPHKLDYQKHYLADSASTEWNIHLRMKIGSDHQSKGMTEGIHWHIHENTKVEYIAGDPARLNIPWVRYINLATGDTVIYMDSESPIDEASVASAEIRTMDCMDCHNRPSHNFDTPQDFIDKAIARGDIPHSLPEIKKVSMDILSGFYENRVEAQAAMETGVKDFYAENYPELVASQSHLIEKAIAGMKAAYSKNIFPEMKAHWDNYPDHIGHIEYDGCFRCHNSTHVSATGKTISKDCNLCHTILLQGTVDKYQVAEFDKSLEFQHPVDVGTDWYDYKCSECHRYLY